MAIAADRSLRKTHVGRSLGTGTRGIRVYGTTPFVPTTAFFLKVRDVVQAAVSGGDLPPDGAKLQKTLGSLWSATWVKTVEFCAALHAE